MAFLLFKNLILGDQDFYQIISTLLLYRLKGFRSVLLLKLLIQAPPYRSHNLCHRPALGPSNKPPAFKIFFSTRIFLLFRRALIMGRGRGGGRGGGPMPRDVQVSKKLSKLLRHDAEQEGLKLGKGGYINLADVVGQIL